MPVEIERKFLVTGTKWRQANGIPIRQGYLCSEKGTTARVRLAGEKAFLTIKGVKKGLTRPEFEYEIPVTDAEQLLKLCAGPLIEKVRHVVVHQGFMWEVDEFLGENEGLVVAEIELEKEDQPFERPDWVGREVTGDPMYFNSNLVTNPYCNWRVKGSIPGAGKADHDHLHN
jgi:adenylate cyclase